MKGRLAITHLRSTIQHMGMNMKRRIFGLTLVSVATAVLVACGGGGSSTPSSSTLSVVPAKGAIYAADVTVFQSNGTTSAGTGTTAAKTDTTNAGKSSVNIGSYSGISVVQVKGNPTAQYYDEGTNADASFAAANILVSAVQAGATSAGVTPLTTMAARLSGIDTDKLGTAGAVPAGLTADNITEGGARLLLALGLPADFNIFAVPTVIKSASDIAGADANARLIALIGQSAGSGGALAYFNNLIAKTPKATIGTDGKLAVAAGTWAADFAAFKTASDNAAARIGVTTKASNFAPSATELTAAVAALKTAVTAGTPPKASGSGSGSGSGSALPN